MTTPAEHYGIALRLLDGIGEPADGMPWPHGDWVRVNWHLRRAAALEGLARATQPRPKGGRPDDENAPSGRLVSPLSDEHPLSQGWGPPNAQRSSQGVPPARVGDVIETDVTGIADNVIRLSDRLGNVWHRNDDETFGSLEHAWYRLGKETSGGTKVTHRDHTFNLIRYWGPLLVRAVRPGGSPPSVHAAEHSPAAPGPDGDSDGDFADPVTKHAMERMRAQLDQLRELAETNQAAVEGGGRVDTAWISPSMILDILGDPPAPVVGTGRPGWQDGGWMEDAEKITTQVTESSGDERPEPPVGAADEPADEPAAGHDEPGGTGGGTGASADGEPG